MYLEAGTPTCAKLTSQQTCNANTACIWMQVKMVQFDNDAPAKDACEAKMSINSRTQATVKVSLVSLCG